MQASRSRMRQAHPRPVASHQDRRRPLEITHPRIQAKISATPPDADSAAVGLAVMAMLERSWLMARHNEISSMSREAVLNAIIELMWRMVY